MANDDDRLARGRAKQRAEQQEEVIALKEDGNIAFKAGQAGRAVRFYTDAIELDFTFGDDESVTAVLYANRAAAYLLQADAGWDEALEDAERDCRRALERNPTAKVWVRCAKACERLQRVEAAFECLAEALLLEPANTAVRQALAALRAGHAAAAERPLAATEHTMARLRKRAAARRERGAQKQAIAYDEAIALLTEGTAAMSAPSADACDDGVANDEARAAQLTQAAADQGDASAQYSPGVLYDSAGVAKAEARAAQLYQAAADQGDADAQYNLGVAYTCGQGVAKDEARSAQLYQAAADQGHSDAQYNLGVAYAFGQGVTQDEARAVQLHKAAKGGAPGGQLGVRDAGGGTRRP